MRPFILYILLSVWTNIALAQTATEVACPDPRWAGQKYTVADLANLEKSYESAKEQMAAADPGLAMSMITLSYALFSDRNATRAEPLFLAGLAKLAQLGTPADANMAQTLAYMAELAYCRQALGQVEKLYLQAIAISEKLPLSKRQQLVSSLQGLAGLFYRQGRFAEGEVVFARSEKIRLELGGKPNPTETFWADAQLVDLVRKGNMAAATAQAQSVVQNAEADEQVMGKQLDEIAAKLAKAIEARPAKLVVNSKENNAAFLLVAELQGKAKFVQAKLIGAERRLGLALTAQAELLHSQKQFAQAEPLYLRALALMQEDDGKEKAVSAGQILSDLGMLYRARGENEKALSFQTRSLAVLLPLLGAAHPDVIESEQELAFLRKQLAGGPTAKE